MQAAPSLPHVVILGGGFAGLYCARALHNAAVRVTVVDHRNHHLFQPLLYQVATATLTPSDIAAPIRGLASGWGAKVLLAEVEGVDPARKVVRLTDGELPYDFLLLATGVTHSYFGNDQWARHAPGLKTVEDALDIRERVLLAFERAERETDPVRRRELLTFVLIGAGPTGVELAGALAEISRHALVGEFHHIDPSQARILLLEGAPSVLPSFPEKLREKAHKKLRHLGVEVRTGARVTDIDEGGVSLGAERIPARTVLWCAGVAGSPVARSLGVPLDPSGRVKVTQELAVPGLDGVFVAGDLAYLEQDGAPIPGVAPAAMQQGKHVAVNILRELAGLPPKPFRYWDRGNFAVIGRGAAVGVAFQAVKMWGFFAWLTWLFVHILFLIGFRSKVAVLLNWAHSYLAFQRSARLITGTAPRVGEPPGRPRLEQVPPPDDRGQRSA